MAAQENLPRLPRDIKFRVLIIGRANAGKTSILQRVCDTTESPEIYINSSGVGKQVRLSP
jgi:GTP-binding protein EngB required for normal cell division